MQPERDEQGNPDDQVAPPGHAAHGIVILQRLPGGWLVEHRQQEAE